MRCTQWRIQDLQTRLNAVVPWIEFRDFLKVDCGYLSLFDRHFRLSLTIDSYRIYLAESSVKQNPQSYSSSHSVHPTASARNLGFNFDFRLYFSDSTSSVSLSRACLYHITIDHLRRLRPVLDFDVYGSHHRHFFLFTPDLTTAIQCTIVFLKHIVKSPSTYSECSRSCCCCSSHSLPSLH